MSNYYEMYTRISNPLTDDVLRRVINLYSRTDEGLYYLLTHEYTDRKDYSRRSINELQKDIFYSNLFNVWKNNVVKKPREKVKQFIDKGINYENDIVSSDYYTLQERLRKIENIKSMKKFNELDKDPLIGKYCFSNYYRHDDWCHIESKKIFQELDVPRFHVNHRLYLNIEGGGLHELSNQFFKRCLENRIPFYFKFAENFDRDDTMVIYSSDENLEKYINILHEIINERPHLKQYIHEPPLLTGKIDGWIGYGSEPQEEHSSYNYKRESVIDYAIKENLKKWIKDNKDRKKIRYKNHIFTIEEFLAYNITKAFVDSRLQYLKMEEKNKHEVTLNSLKDRYGLTKELLLDPSFKAHIYKEVLKDIPSRLNDYLNNKPFNNIFEITLVDGKKADNLSDFFCYKIGEKQIKTFAVVAATDDKNFIHKVRKTINSRCNSYSIDADKFCFDIGPRDALFSEDVKTVIENDYGYEKPRIRGR